MPSRNRCVFRPPAVFAALFASFIVTMSPLFAAATLRSPGGLALLTPGGHVTTFATCGGSAVDAAVYLTEAAPPEGVVVQLSATSGTVRIPATLTVAGGSASQGFRIATASVTSSTDIGVMAQQGTTVQRVSLRLDPVMVASVTLRSPSLTGGVKTDATITMNCPAPSTGLSVPVSNSNPAVAEVPASVMVAAGATAATLPILAQPTALDATTAITAGDKSASLTVMAPIPLSLSFQPTIVGASSASGLVTLSGPAPSAGFPVALASGSPAAAVPGSVNVAAGQTGVKFGIRTTAVSSDTNVTITAGIGATAKSGQLTVMAPSLNALTLDNSVTAGGNTMNASVTLNGPAPAGGLDVALSSSAPGATSVPTKVMVAEGQTSALFGATTSVVASDTQVTITGATAAATRSAQLTVKAPPTVTSFSLATSSVTGGSPVNATVTLSGPAPAAGFNVPFESSGPAASVPSQITVPRDQTTAVGQVTTFPVSTDTTATITAGPRTAELLILKPAIASATLAASEAVGGTAVAGSVILTGPAPAGGIAIAVTSQNGAIASSKGLTIGQGQSSGALEVNTTAVPSDTPITLTVGAGPMAKTVQLTVKPPVLESITITPTTVKGGGTFAIPNGGATTVSVKLSGKAPAGGWPVTLTSSHPDTLSVTNATVPEGWFMITQFPSAAAVSTDTEVTLTAGDGTSTKSTKVMVLAHVLDRFDVVGGSTYDPAQNMSVQSQGTSVSLIGGVEKAGVNVGLDGPVPPGGRTIDITSSDPTVPLPSTVTVPYGYVNGTVSVDTLSVPSDLPVTITARYGNVTKSGTITVKPIGLDSVVLRAWEGGNTSIVRGGKNVGASVRLNANAPAGGIVVPLSSSHPNIIGVPASITVQTAAMGNEAIIKAADVTEDTVVTVTAGDPGKAKSASITVKALAVQSLSVNYQSVTGGTTLTGSLMLNDKAPAGGQVVPLTSNVAEIVVPATVTVPADQYSATFPITTSAVSANITGIVGAGAANPKTVNILLRP